MKQVITFIALASAAALPVGVFAQSAPSSTHHVAEHNADPGKDAVHGSASRSAQRHAMMTADQRNHLLHASSPHIITIETELQSVRDTSQGLARLASLEGQTLSNEYSDHVVALNSSAAAQLDVAARHITHLRASVQELGMTDMYSPDFAHAEQAIQEAQRAVNDITQARVSQAYPSQIQADARTIADRMTTATTAIEHIEHTLR